MEYIKLDEIFTMRRLTKAEKLVAHTTLSGLKADEIADKLCLSSRTIKFHLTSIYRKFGAISKSSFVQSVNDLYHQPTPLPLETVVKTSILDDLLSGMDELRRNIVDLKLKLAIMSVNIKPVTLLVEEELATGKRNKKW